MKDHGWKRELKEFEAYLICGEKSRGTIEKYLRDVRTFLRFLKTEGTKEPAGPEEVSGITKEKNIAWKESLVRSGYAAATVNSMLASLNSFLRFYGLFSLCVRPLRRQRRIFRDRKRELSKEEYLRLVRAAEETGKRRLSFILQTIASTGIRISELRFITAESLRTRRAEVNCKGKQRTVLLTGELCRKLMRYCREEGIAGGAGLYHEKRKSGEPFQYLDRDEAPVQPRRCGTGQSLSAQSQESLCARILQSEAGYRQAGGSSGTFEHRYDPDLYHGKRTGT